MTILLSAMGGFVFAVLVLFAVGYLAHKAAFRTAKARLDDMMADQLAAMDIAQTFQDKLDQGNVINFLEYEYASKDRKHAVLVTVKRRDSGLKPVEVAAVGRYCAVKALSCGIRLSALLRRYAKDAGDGEITFDAFNPKKFKELRDDLSKVEALIAEHLPRGSWVYPSSIEEFAEQCRAGQLQREDQEEASP